ncbi:piwi domain-containing protein [Hirsutella rhossiliensis]
MLSAHLIDAFKSRLELWQKYNQGTLPDNIATAANELESLTYELCYLYGRAIKAVSICPPAYYADIVCERARAYRPEIFEASDTDSVSTAGKAAPAASRQVHETLKDTIYYI